MNTWYKCENGDSVQPAAQDTTSSKKWNYVRKDFRRIAAQEKDGQIYPEHWEWMEMKVAKETWGTYLQGETNAANIDYLAMMADIEIPTEEE